MKVLFTADWHIKLGQKNVPKDWQINRFRLFFKDLETIKKDIGYDVLIVGGDVFDKVPTLEELSLYYEFVLSCNSTCFIIPGNHEALKKNTTFLTYLKEITKKLNPLVEIIDEFWCLKHLNIDIIPYNRLKEFEKEQRLFHSDILVTHVRGEIPPHVQPEVNLEIFDRWKLVLAGDLHSHSNSQRNIVYPGSPMTTSFHRSKVSTGVILADTETAEWDFVELELPQLIRKTVTSTDEMVPTEYDHTIYEIEGDIGNLSVIQASELLDKKIVKRENTSVLGLKRGMTVAEELHEYLMVVLNLDETQSKRAIGLLNDIIKDSNLE